MGKAVTYGNFICDIRPLKSEKYRTRLTVGGDRLPYEADRTKQMPDRLLHHY